MCALLGRNSRFAAQHTTPTSTTMSPGHTPPSRSVCQYEAFLLEVFLIVVVILNWTISSFCLKKPTIEEKVRSSGENRLDIQSILTIHAADLADTGNISCTGTNEAGVNSSTTYLLVVGKPQKRSLLLLCIVLKSVKHSQPLKQFDSSKQTRPTSGCCPSCPLNWPTRVFQWRWTREKIWSSPCW